MSDSTVDAAVALQEEATRLLAAGEHAGAEACCRGALDILEQLSGADSPDFANLLTDLCDVLDARGRYDDALICARRAVSIMRSVAEAVDGLDGYRILVRALGAESLALRNLGRYEEAEDVLRATTVTAESRLGDGDEQTIAAFNGLGVLYKFMGRFDDAEAAYRRALDGIAAAGDGRSDRTDGEPSFVRQSMLATLYHNLGGLEHARGRAEQAEPHARRAYDMRRAIRGDDHPETVADLAALAGVLEELGRYGEAEQIYRRALDFFRRWYGPEHYEVAVNLGTLASVLEATGRADEAEQLYRQALEMKSKLIGPDHPDVALTANNLALLLSARGERDEAEALMRRAVAIAEAKLPPDSHMRAAYCENLRGLSEGKD